MALVPDATNANGVANTTNQTAGGTTTLSFTVASGTNNTLYVIIKTWDNGGTGSGLSGLTYNSVACSKIGSGLANGVVYVEAWQLASPTVGTANLVATVAGKTDKLQMDAITFSGADQSGGVDVFNTFSGTAGTVTGSLTTTNALEYLIDGVAHFSANNPSSNSGTIITSTSTSGISMVSQYATAVLSGTNSMNYVYPDPGDLWVYIVLAVKPASGGTLYTKSITGTFSTNGVLTKLTARTYTASFSVSGVLSRLFARLFTASASGSGNLSRVTAKTPFTAIFSVAGLLNRRTARTQQATYSAAGTFIKQTNKVPFTATFSSSGVVSGAHGVAKLLTATFSTNGQLANRTLARTLTATYSTAGSLARRFFRSFTATFSTSGVLSRSTGVAPFVATLVASGALSRLPGKSLSGTYLASGQLTKRPNKSFAATFSSAGNLFKSLARILAGVFSDSGSLTGVKVGSHNQTFTATFSTAGNIINRSIGRQHAATYQTAGNLNKVTSRRLTATHSTSGNLSPSKIMHKTLTATFSASGILIRTTGKLFVASYRTLGSLIGAIFPGPIKLPAHWIQVITGNPASYTHTDKNDTQWQQRDDGNNTSWKQIGGDKS